MRTPEDVLEMRRLHRLGLGTRQIAARLGCSRTTVQVWLQRGRWQKPARRRRRRALAGWEEWLRDRLVQHEGNADVVRQELGALGVRVSLRTVERAVEPFRRELRAAVVATTRFETPPGYQLQIDFGQRQVWIGGEKTKVWLFVATLGCSRRMHVRVFPGERQGHWFEGLESTFVEIGGVPETVLPDNAKALVKHHNAATREVVFHHRFLAFAKHWRFRPQACAPYRARTKGKDESGVGYVKKTGIAGRRFESLAELEAHLARWTREVANRRIHGTTGRVPNRRGSDPVGLHGAVHHRGSAGGEPGEGPPDRPSGRAAPPLPEAEAPDRGRTRISAARSRRRASVLPARQPALRARRLPGDLEPAGGRVGAGLR